MLSRVMYDPLAEMRAMDDVFDRFFAVPFGSGLRGMQQMSLPVDVIERDNKLVIRAAVPGVDPKDLDVSIENNVLTIRGETKAEERSENTKVYRLEVSYGSFSRSIRLPANIDVAGVDAEFVNGCVTITIPKAAEEHQSRRIDVRSSESRKEIPIEGQSGDDKATASSNRERKAMVR